MFVLYCEEFLQWIFTVSLYGVFFMERFYEDICFGYFWWAYSKMEKKNYFGEVRVFVFVLWRIFTVSLCGGFVLDICCGYSFWIFVLDSFDEPTARWKKMFTVHTWEWVFILWRVFVFILWIFLFSLFPLSLTFFGHCYWYTEWKVVLTKFPRKSNYQHPNASSLKYGLESQWAFLYLHQELVH